MVVHQPGQPKVYYNTKFPLFAGFFLLRIFPSKVAKFQEKQSCCWRTCHRVWIYVKCCVHTSHAYYFCNILVSVKLHAIVSQAMFLWCTSNKPWHFYQKYQFGLIFFYPNYASKFFHQPIKGESNNCWNSCQLRSVPHLPKFCHANAAAPEESLTGEGTMKFHIQWLTNTETTLIHVVNVCYFECLYMNIFWYVEILYTHCW